MYEINHTGTFEYFVQKPPAHGSFISGNAALTLGITFSIMTYLYVYLHDANFILSFGLFVQLPTEITLNLFVNQNTNANIFIAMRNIHIKLF